MRADDVLALQRTAGNQAVQRMVGGGGLLRLGSKGPDVVQLQQGLIGAGASLTADGSFGPKTKQAVVAFQQSAGLGADGVVGPKTWSALQAGTVKLGAGAGGKAASVDPQMATLAGLLASIGDLVRKRAKGASTDGGALSVEPTAREGWFDDAADWVEDTASSAASAVSGAASSVSDWVEQKADAVTDWVEDKASAVGSWVEDKAGAAASAASGAAASGAGAAAAAVAQSAANIIGGPAKVLADAVGAIAAELPPLVKELVGQLDQVVAGGGAVSGVTSGVPVEELIDKAKAALAELSGGDGGELNGGAGGAVLDFKKATVPSGAEFTFDDETFGELRKTLTARTTEIGRARPSIGAIVLNGKDGTKLPGDEVVKSAKVSITENITLPLWSKENGPKVQDVQRQEWQRYRGAVAAHEDLHAADDEGIYGKAVAGLVGKTVTDAFAAIDTATEAGNNQGPKRDTANPAPSLNPAGVEKV